MLQIILKGAKPADLPVMQSEKFELEKPQNGESAQRHRAREPDCPRRHGHRIGDNSGCSDVRYWHLADTPICTAHVRFWG